MLQRLCAAVLATACALGVGSPHSNGKQRRRGRRAARRRGPRVGGRGDTGRAGDLLRSRPLAFERNVGQYPARRRSSSRGAGYLLSLQPTEARLHLQAPAPRQPTQAAAPRLAHGPTVRHDSVKPTSA